MILQGPLGGGGVSKGTGNVAVKEQFSKIAVNHTMDLRITSSFEVRTHQTGSLQHSISIHSWTLH